MDVVERDNEIEITAELPGLEEKDVDVSMNDGVLTIRGEKKLEKEEKGATRHVYERSYGSFSRSIELPNVKPEDVKAALEKGVLKVTFPKPVQKKPEARKIDVKSAKA
jgi:HSP20 family protein